MRESTCPESVRALQERAARALPAEYVEHVGEWWLRRTETSSWWMGTVLPHGDADRDELDRLIATAERFYVGFGAPVRFQISPGACPAALDAALAARGYRWDGPMSLQTASTATVRALSRTEGTAVAVSESPTGAWFDAWYAVHGDNNAGGVEREMLARVRQPSAYVSVLDGPDVIVVGRAVADSGWVGVFGMATLPEVRGKGVGRIVLTALADWAASRGADRMYLQVEAANAAAVRLYERAGFTEACAYHYRTAPDG